MTTLADIYGTVQKNTSGAPALQQAATPVSQVPTLWGQAVGPSPGAVVKQIIASEPPRLQTATPSVSAGQAQVQPGSQPPPSMASVQQANTSGVTPQQLAIMNATQAAMVRQQQAAAIAAQKAQAARLATPQGAADNMVATRGVFGNGPTAATPAARPNTQMPAMAPPRGVTNYGGA